ncbi:ECF transporter S component [Haploplasma axanthum]|uniref:Pantothenic acid ECF transporter S component PanT n=1 Tax=Haploplasma axanthum TaxID=29552 RepID=A0A449BE80_HAPAX|nr:ECF transporter S component [Haploplasma axanthum]VEU80763.1 Pantothenic acid ECF transporter S component PanT [Haploplasma axanthum]
MKKRNRVFELVLTAVLGAIILFMSLVPQIGFITILPGVSITLVHIPVLIGVFLLSLKSSIILGFFFGLGSLFAALLSAKSAFDMAFVFPWISILPRILFAVIAFYIAKGFKKLMNVKNGKFILFGIVSIVTALSLFFGIKETVKKVVYNDYNVEVQNYNALVNNPDSTEEDINLSKITMDDLKISSDDNYKKVNNIVTPISIVVIVGLVGLYFVITMKKNGKHIYIPSVFILATIAHTVLVIGSVALFKPSAFEETFGNNQSVIAILYLIAMANGLIEAIFGALIGTPITIATKDSLEREE